MQKILSIVLFSIFINPFLFSQEIVPPEFSADSAVLMDFSTGKIFLNKNGSLIIPPASMTKVITLFIAYRYMSENHLDPQTVIEIGATGSAFSRPPGSSLMGLEEGQRVTYLELMKGLAVASGNDAAYALARYISGSPEEFVDLMNRTTHELGFDEFHFVDPDGWSEKNFITAESYARFCRVYIQSFPRALKELHSVPSFTHPRKDQIPPGARIKTARTKKNTNILLGKVPGVDGLKTGYIPESGFNFTATALRGKTRFIAVIMGVHRSSFYQGLQERARESEILLEYGFSRFRTYDFLPEYNDIKVRIWKGEKDFLAIVPEESFRDTVEIGHEKELIAVYHIRPDIKAPVTQGEYLGEVSLFGSSFLYTSDLKASISIDKGPFTKRLKDSIKLLLKKMR